MSSSKTEVLDVSASLISILSPFCLDFLIQKSIASMKSVGYIWGSSSNIEAKVKLSRNWKFKPQLGSDSNLTVIWLTEAHALLKKTGNEKLKVELCLSLSSILDSQTIGVSANDDNAFQQMCESLFQTGKRLYQKDGCSCSISLLQSVVNFETLSVGSEHNKDLLGLICERMSVLDTRMSGLLHLSRFLRSISAKEYEKTLDYKRYQTQLRALLQESCSALFTQFKGRVVRTQEATLITEIVNLLSSMDPEYVLESIIVPVLQGDAVYMERSASHCDFSSAQRAAALGCLAVIAKYCKENTTLHDGRSTYAMMHTTSILVCRYVARSNPSNEVANALLAFPFICAEHEAVVKRVVECAFSYDDTLIDAGRDALTRFMESNTIEDLDKMNTLDICLSSPKLQFFSVANPYPEVEHISCCLETVERTLVPFATRYNKNHCSMKLGMLCLLVVTHPSKRIRNESRQILKQLGLENEWNSKLLEKTCTRIIRTFMASEMNGLVTKLTSVNSTCGISIANERKTELEMHNAGTSMKDNDPLLWWQCQAHVSNYPGFVSSYLILSRWFVVFHLKLVTKQRKFSLKL